MSGLMTVATGGRDLAAVVRAMADANVQFVLVGEPSTGRPLQLVVSRHPTNLDALGRALDHLGSTLRAPGVGTLEREEPGDAVPRRVGDPMGTVCVSTSAGDVDLVFGGPRRSLYAEVVLHAEEREVGGRCVQWTGELAAAERAPTPTGPMLGRRLLSLAEGLAHLVDRRGEDPPRDGDSEAGS